MTPDLTAAMLFGVLAYILAIPTILELYKIARGR